MLMIGIAIHIVISGTLFVQMPPEVPEHLGLWLSLEGPRIHTHTPSGLDPLGVRERVLNFKTSFTR
jgi:hypothetical protein